MNPHDPIPLKDAVALFPTAKLTVSTLRLERDKGNLRTFFVGSREFTTKANMEDMFALCAVTPKARGSGSGQRGETKRAASHTAKSGSSETDGSSAEQAAALEIAKGLKGHSAPTSPRSAQLPKQYKKAAYRAKAT